MGSASKAQGGIFAQKEGQKNRGREPEAETEKVGIHPTIENGLEVRALTWNIGDQVHTTVLFASDWLLGITFHISNIRSKHWMTSYPGFIIHGYSIITSNSILDQINPFFWKMLLTLIWLWNIRHFPKKLICQNIPDQLCAWVPHSPICISHLRTGCVVALFSTLYA